MSETVTIYYERKLSDGDYGSEGLSMGITLELRDGVSALDDGTTADIFAKVRRNVLGHLASSRTPRVAKVAAIELGELPARLQPVDDDFDDPPF